MKNKFILALSAIILATGISVTTTQPVQATTWYINHCPYFVTHKARLNRNVTFYKLHLTKVTYKNRIIGRKKLKKGSIINIKKGGATYPWFITGHGMTENRYHSWLGPKGQSWFTIIK